MIGWRYTIAAHIAKSVVALAFKSLKLFVVNFFHIEWWQKTLRISFLILPKKKCNKNNRIKNNDHCCLCWNFSGKKQFKFELHAATDGKMTWITRIGFVLTMNKWMENRNKKNFKTIVKFKKWKNPNVNMNV